MKHGKKAPARDDNNNKDDRYISTKAAARLINVSIFSVQRWFDAGLLSGSRLPGGRRRIAVNSLEQFMKKHSLIPQALEGRGQKRVLIVDDDARLLDILKDGLEQTGKYVVRHAVSGLEGGLAVAEFLPDAMVIDVMLDDVRGPTVVRRIRETKAGRIVRIIAISGKAGPGDVRDVLDSGANAFLRKPFSLTDLIKAIESKRTFHK
jgi:CheY-like chemotaxis protein